MAEIASQINDPQPKVGKTMRAFPTNEPRPQNKKKEELDVSPVTSSEKIDDGSKSSVNTSASGMAATVPTAPPSSASSVQGSPSDPSVAPTTHHSHERSPKSNPKLPACADCKRLKVKCVRSDPDNYVSDCLRCIKKKLPCVTGLSTKKTSHEDRYNPQSFERKGRIHHRFDTLKEVQMSSILMRDQLMNAWKLLTTRDDLRLQLLERYDYTSLAKPSSNVLKRGLLTHDQVVKRINIYREELYPKWSVVECAPVEDLDQFMTDYPVLFHTILDVSSQLVQDEGETETSIILHNMVLRTVIDEIMVVSVKSVELLKCLILLTQWYNESELYHQQRLHVLTALAVSVSYDLGLGGATITTTGSNAPPFEQMVTPQGASDCHTTENYTLWVAVYTALFQSLMANRRPLKSHWNKYTEQAVNVLKELSLEKRAKRQGSAQSSGDSPNTNKNGFKGRLESGFDASGLPCTGDFQLWGLAKLRHLQETIVLTVFKQQNETVAIDLNTPAGQYTVHQLSMAIDEIERSFEAPSLRWRMVIASTRTLLHQAVLYAKYDEALGRAPFTNFSLNPQSGPLSFQAAESFRECVRNALFYLDAIVSRESRDIVAEICNIWTSVTLCCDVLLKCRACAIFNRYYADAYFVTEEEVSRIFLIMEKFDAIVRDFPNCNNAVSFGFFIKLLVCHHDARLHHHSTRLHPDLFGDPQFVMKLANSAQGASEKLIKRPAELLDSAYAKTDRDYPQSGLDRENMTLSRPTKAQKYENLSGYERGKMRNSLMTTPQASHNLTQNINQSMNPNMRVGLNHNMSPSLNRSMVMNQNMVNQNISSQGMAEELEPQSQGIGINMDLMAPNAIGVGIMPDSANSGNVLNGNDMSAMKDYPNPPFPDTQVPARVGSLPAETQRVGRVIMSNSPVANPSINFRPNKPYSPVSIDQQPQSGEMPNIGPSPNEDYSWNETPGLENGPVEFDSQALNYIESFWGDFATQLGDGTQSTFYFPV